MQATAGRTGSRIRSRSRLESPAGPNGRVTANGPQAGQMELEDVTLDPDPVAPNGTLDVIAHLANHALVISPTDNDRCNPAGANEAGLSTEVIVEAGWGEQASTVVCAPGPAGFATVNRRDASVTLTNVPATPGEYSISVRIRLTGSGTESGSTGRTLAVEEGAQSDPGCVRNADCPGNEVCQDGSCIDDPNGNDIIGDLFGDVQTGALVIVVLFIAANALAPA